MNKQKADLIRGFFVLVVMCGLLMSLSFWLYDKSALGNPVCKQMSSQGYYETEWDTAGHESCKIVHEGSRWNPFETNQTCMEQRLEIDEKNLVNYGMHCVWGGPGYWAFVASFGIPCMLLALISMWFAALWTYYKRKNKKFIRTPRC